MSSNSSGSTVKSQLEAIKDYVEEGNFLQVKKNETVFIKSLSGTDNRAGEMVLLKKCGFFWLTEIGNAVKYNDLKKLKLAYEQFMVMYDKIVNFVPSNDVDLNGTTNSVGEKVAVLPAEKLDDCEGMNGNIKGNGVSDVSYNLNDDFFTEEHCKEIDFQVQQRYKEVSPDVQEKVCSSFLSSDQLKETINQMMEHKFKSLMDHQFKLLMNDKFKLLTAELEERLQFLKAETMKKDEDTKAMAEGKEGANQQKHHIVNPYKKSKHEGAPRMNSSESKKKKQRQVWFNDLTGTVQRPENELRSGKQYRK